MASRSTNAEELIQHTVSVRYRAYGTGVLRTTLFSYQDVNSSVLPIIELELVADRLPTVIANFRNQRTQVQFQVTSYDETFTISKIIAFTKPSATSYPST